MISPKIVVVRRPVLICHYGRDWGLFRMPDGSLRLGRFQYTKAGKEIIWLPGVEKYLTPEKKDFCESKFKKLNRKIDFCYPQNGEGNIDAEDLGPRKGRLALDAMLLRIVAYESGEENILAPTIARKRAKMNVEERAAQKVQEPLPQINLAQEAPAIEKQRESIWQKVSKLFEMLKGIFRLPVRAACLLKNALFF